MSGTPELSGSLPAMSKSKQKSGLYVSQGILKVGGHMERLPSVSRGEEVRGPVLVHRPYASPPNPEQNQAETPNIPYPLIRFGPS